jgi:hypothetical protein
MTSSSDIRGCVEMTQTYKKYFDVLKYIEVPDSIIKITEGELENLMYFEKIPFENYGYPPALIPLWSTGSPSYVGIWKHWFLDRPANYVSLDLEHPHVYEIARSSEQLLASFFLNLIESRGRTNEIDETAARVGFKLMDQVEHVCKIHGNHPIFLGEIAEFGSFKPHEFVANREEYTGFHPFEDSEANNPWLCCGYEISTSQFHNTDMILPPWFDEANNKSLVFDAYLRESELKNAWLTLNSSGWEIAKATTACKMLAESANDLGFSLLAEAWIEKNTDDPFVDGY